MGEANEDRLGGNERRKPEKERGYGAAGGKKEEIVCGRGYTSLWVPHSTTGPRSGSWHHTAVPGTVQLGLAAGTVQLGQSFPSCLGEGRRES